MKRVVRRLLFSLRRVRLGSAIRKSLHAKISIVTQLDHL
jgi:hypothetical protein